MAKLQRIQYNGKDFMWSWVINSLLVYPLVIFIGGASLVAIAFVANIFLRSIVNDSSSALLSSVIMLGTIGAVVGGCVGVLQSRLLRKHLHWTADGWVTASLVGGVLGAFVVALITFVSRSNVGVSSYYSYNSSFTSMFQEFGFWAMPFFVCVVSIFQALVLRNAIDHAWIWVLANIAAGIVFASLASNNPIQGYASNDDLFQLAYIIFVPVVQGFITGNTLLFLFERFGFPIALPESKYAKTASFKPSVWDEAI